MASKKTTRRASKKTGKAADTPRVASEQVRVFPKTKEQIGLLEEKLGLRSQGEVVATALALLNAAARQAKDGRVRIAPPKDGESGGIVINLKGA